jgi:hypothetical protein
MIRTWLGDILMLSEGQTTVGTLFTLREGTKATTVQVWSKLTLLQVFLQCLWIKKRMSVQAFPESHMA